MIKKNLVVIIIVFLGGLLSAPISHAQAAKLRIRKTAPTSSSGISFSSLRLSRATHSVVLTLNNLNQAKKIGYTLSYSANGIPQGVVGSLIPSGASTESRDLYFGTCSKGVCTPHYNIQYASLIVKITLPSGKIHAKKYIIKI